MVDEGCQLCDGGGGLNDKRGGAQMKAVYGKMGHEEHGVPTKFVEN